MKKMFKISALLMLLMAFSAATFAQVTATANASAVLQAPLTITAAAAGLNFGTLASTAGGTVTVATNSSISATAGITLLGGVPSAASFTVSGIANATFTITIPGSITLSDGGTESLTVNNFVRNPAGNGTLDGSGAATILIGADLVVPVGQAAGTYTNNSDLTVEINYN